MLVHLARLCVTLDVQPVLGHVDVDRLFAHHVGLQHLVLSFDLAFGIGQLMLVLLVLLGLVLLLRFILVICVVKVILILFRALHIVSVVDLLLLLENFIHFFVVQSAEKSLVVSIAEYAARRLDLFLPIALCPLVFFTQETASTQAFSSFRSDYRRQLFRDGYERVFALDICVHITEIFSY